MSTSKLKLDLLAGRGGAADTHNKVIRTSRGVVPRYFNRKGHWVRNPNHPATAAGGVGPPPRRLRTWTSRRRPARPPLTFPQPSSATRVRKISTRSCCASRPRATSSTTRSARRASRRMSTAVYEILHRFQAKSDEFYRRKRESIFVQLTPGNSVHRPIVPSTWKPRTRRTPTRDMCVEDLAPRRIDFYKVTRHSRATRNQPNNRCFSTPSGALISSAAAGGEEQNRPIS